MIRTDQSGPEWQLNSVIKHTLQLKNEAEKVGEAEEQLRFHCDQAGVNSISIHVQMNWFAYCRRANGFVLTTEATFVRKIKPF